MPDEAVDLVDENDKVIGETTKEKAHRTGEIHRAAHVFVFNSSGKIFLQFRPRTKFLYPGVWDSAVGEHIKRGESYEGGAKRGLSEELNLKMEKLVPAGIVEIDLKDEKVHNHEFVGLFECVFDGKIRVNKKEIEKGKFFSIEEAKRLSLEGKTAPSFKKIFEFYLGNRNEKNNGKAA